MGSRRTSFDKLQRDRAKKAKAAAKRDRRISGDTPPGEVDAPADETPVTDDGGELSAADLLQRIEVVHRRFEAGTISYEEFEEEKADLLARLPID